MLILYARLRAWMSSFVKVNRDPSGEFHIRLRPPSRRRRKLYNETMQLVSELRAYVKSQPDPAVERIKSVLAANGPKGRIWNFQDTYEADLFNQSKNELNEKFGGRVQYIVGEYRKLGMLPERRSHESMDEPTANDIRLSAVRLPWVHEAANQLEVVARRL
jgi:hypothetical protein